MTKKINPIGIAVGVVLIAVAIFVFMRSKDSYGPVGSEGKAVIVKPDNPNDPKFTQNLPAGIGGGIR